MKIIFIAVDVQHVLLILLVQFSRNRMVFLSGKENSMLFATGVYTRSIPYHCRGNVKRLHYIRFSAFLFLHICRKFCYVHSKNYINSLGGRCILLSWSCANFVPEFINILFLISQASDVNLVRSY